MVVSDHEVEQYRPDYRMDECDIFGGILGGIGESEQPFDPLIQVIRIGGLVKDRPIPPVNDVHVVRRKPEPADRARIVERVLGEDALQLQELGLVLWTCIAPSLIQPGEPSWMNSSIGQVNRSSNSALA